MPRTGTRPTTDRVRESLFNVLAARLDLTGAAVLDLYAGSGALGLEALSRGAASATFVESDARAASVIAKNIAELGVTGATLRRGPVAAVLAVGQLSGPWTWCWPTRPTTSLPARSTRCWSRWPTGGWTTAGTVVVVERANLEPAADLAGWLDRVARPPLWRHPAGDGRTGLTRPASVVTHEWRGMPRIIRPGDPRPYRHLRARGRAVRRGRGGGAGQPQQEGHVQPRRAHRDDRRVHVASAEPAGRVRARAWSSTSSSRAA